MVFRTFSEGQLEGQRPDLEDDDQLFLLPELSSLFTLLAVPKKEPAFWAVSGNKKNQLEPDFLNKEPLSKK